jgi:predicted RNase H-related nuclease YkuK (DUF458 family)
LFKTRNVFIKKGAAMKFKRLTDYKSVDVKEYVTDYIINNDDIKVLVGCDSQQFGRSLKYATVIVLYHQGKGGHVLFRAERVNKTNTIKEKILGEVNRSIEIATYLKYECGIDVDQIDLDINDDPMYKSNTALTEAVGYVLGMGFNVAHKPEELYAVRAANTLCR